MNDNSSDEEINEVNEYSPIFVDIPTPPSPSLLALGEDAFIAADGVPLDDVGQVAEGKCTDENKRAAEDQRVQPSDSTRVPKLAPITYEMLSAALATICSDGSLPPSTPLRDVIRELGQVWKRHAFSSTRAPALAIEAPSTSRAALQPMTTRELILRDVPPEVTNATYIYDLFANIGIAPVGIFSSRTTLSSGVHIWSAVIRFVSVADATSVMNQLQGHVTIGGLIYTIDFHHEDCDSCKLMRFYMGRAAETH